MNLRATTAEDAGAVRALLEGAFGGTAEADLVEALARNGDLVLSAVAQEGPQPVGFVAFSRLTVATAARPFPGVALAPLAVTPEHQRQGIGAALIGFAHQWLKERGEALCVVLGEPEYYHRFGYTAQRAAGFDSPYPAEHLMALAFAAAPSRGRLVYPPAFAGL